MNVYLCCIVRQAIAWGALGRQMFSAGQTYYMVPAALGIGCLLPIPGYILHRMYPKNTFFANFNTGVVVQYSCYLSGPYSIPLLLASVVGFCVINSLINSVWSCSWYQYFGEHCHGHRLGLATLPP